MTRRLFARDSIRFIVLLILIDGVAGLIFAASGRPNPSGALPPFAAPSIDIVLGQSQEHGTVLLPLIRLMLRRPDTDTIANLFLGMLVWLPALAAALAAAFQMIALRSDIHDRQNGAQVYRRALIFMLAVVGIAVSWSWSDNALLGHLLLILGVASFMSISLFRELNGYRSAIIIAASFLAAGVAVSATSHRMCVVYHGYPPLLEIDKPVQDRFLSDLQQQMLTKSGIAADEIFDRIQRLPKLNEWSSEPNVFAKNRFAADAAIVTALIYILGMACFLDGFMKRYHLSTHFLVSYGIGLYLAVGAIFGLLYFNDVVAESGRQNMLSLSADVLAASDAEFATIERQFQVSGWSSKLEKSVENARRFAGPGIGGLLQATLAMHWSNSVIAQELPQTVREGSSLHSRSSLVTSQTLADMFYYSFASFTTTGYGDVRPVSDRARFWSIIENIAELLFTSIFFAIMFSSGARQVNENTDEKTHGMDTLGRAIGSCLLLVFLCRCMPAEHLTSSISSGGSIRLCPQVAPADKLEVDAVIDDSGSMRGYFDLTPSVYATKLATMLTALHARLDLHVYRLSGSAEPACTVEQVVKRDYYRTADTPLVKAFSHRPTNPAAAVLVVSDLEQDEPAGIATLTDTIKEAAKERPFISVYCIPTLYRHKSDDAYRPWYVVIMAATAEQLELIEKAGDLGRIAYDGKREELSSRRDHGPLVFYSRSFMSVDSIDWVSEGRDDSLWQVAAESSGPQPLKCPRCDTFVSSAVFQQLTPEARRLHFVGRIETDIPVRDIERLQFTVQRHDGNRVVTLDPKAFDHPIVQFRVPSRLALPDLSSINESAHDAAPKVIEAKLPMSTPAGARDPCPSISKANAITIVRTMQSLPIEIEYELPIDGPASQYEISFSAGAVNLALPEWVGTYSTKDRAIWCRTLNLDSIVQAMIESSSETDVFLVHAVTVKAARMQ